jgi:hypothetical protein
MDASSYPQAASADSDPADRLKTATLGMPALSAEEVTQMLLASSLSATLPLVGLIQFMIKEGILDGDKLKAALEPMLAGKEFPVATKMMLDPIWSAFLAQISKPAD